MGYYDAYNAILSVQGTSPRNARIELAKKTISYEFYNSPSYYQVPTYTTSTPLSSTPLDVWILDNSDNKEQKDIVVHPNQTFNNGYLHYWSELDQYYLTIITDQKLGEIYSRGTAMRCYSSIKWIDYSGVIRESWYCIESDAYSGLGIDDGKVLFMPSERRRITIQNNQYSNVITKEKRFIIDGRAWRTVGVNKERTGLIALTLEEHQLDLSRDNLESRIADYYNNIHHKTIKILNGDEIQLLTGSTLQLQYQIYDNEKTVTEPVIFHSSDTFIATVDSNGLISCLNVGNVSITVSLASDSAINDVILVDIASLPIDNFTINILGSDICKIGQTQNYACEVRNNGAIDTSKTVTWSILADDKINSTMLASIVATSETGCTIKANTLQKTGYIQLKSVLISDNSIVFYKKINIKSLI